MAKRTSNLIFFNHSFLHFSFFPLSCKGNDFVKDVRFGYNNMRFGIRDAQRSNFKILKVLVKHSHVALCCCC